MHKHKREVALVVLERSVIKRYRQEMTYKYFKRILFIFLNAFSTFSYYLERCFIN